MKTHQYPKLSFFEAMYMWIYIYITKGKFLTGRGTPEGATSVSLAFLQFWNIEVLWRLLIFILNWDITYSVWIDMCFFTCLVAINTFGYEKRLLNIATRHNALTEKERVRNRRNMWIYVSITVLSVVGGMIAIGLTRETTELDDVKPRTILREPGARDSSEFRRIFDPND